MSYTVLNAVRWGFGLANPNPGGSEDMRALVAGVGLGVRSLGSDYSVRVIVG